MRYFDGALGRTTARLLSSRMTMLVLRQSWALPWLRAATEAAADLALVPLTLLAATHRLPGLTAAGTQFSEATDHLARVLRGELPAAPPAPVPDAVPPLAVPAAATVGKVRLYNLVTDRQVEVSTTEPCVLRPAEMDPESRRAFEHGVPEDGSLLLQYVRRDKSRPALGPVRCPLRSLGDFAPGDYVLVPAATLDPEEAGPKDGLRSRMYLCQVCPQTAAGAPERTSEVRQAELADSSGGAP